MCYDGALLSTGTLHCLALSIVNKMAVLLFHHQQSEKYIILHVINNALGLVVDIFNTCEFKAKNITMG
jgi:hypothetical protein